MIDQLGLYIGLLGSLTAIAGAVLSIWKWIKSNKNGVSPTSPYSYKERVQRFQISKDGHCVAHFRYAVVLNNDTRYHEFFSVVDNSNSYNFNSPVVKAYVNEKDRTKSIEMLRESEKEIRFRLLLPEEARKRKSFDLRYEIDYGKHYPACVEELNEIRRLNPDTKKSNYIAEGAYIQVPTKSLILDLRFEDGYPVSNLVPAVTLGQSTDETSSRNINEPKFHSEYGDEAIARLEMIDPVQGCSYNVRWNLSH